MKDAIKIPNLASILPMNPTTNTSIVQQAYAAFGRGDIPALLGFLDEKVDWQPVYGAGRHVTTGGRRRGRAEVGKFFEQVAQSYQFSVFEPREFIAQGDKVAVLGHYTATVNGTGGKVDSDWVMVFTFQDSRITKFVEFSDSASIDRAWMPVRS